MIKTLRITSILAAALAVILVGFFVFRIVHGVGTNENVREFLSSPGVVEKFKMAEGDRTKNTNSQSSPLVQQAQAFALYLNPPAPKKDPQTGPNKKPISTKLNVTPQFKVIGISYCEKHPEMSMALIDEPGKGIHWVKQSTTVGHLFIEQVTNELVVVKGGTETFKLTLERKPAKSPSSNSTSNVSIKPTNTSRSRSRPQLPNRGRNLIKRVPNKPQPPQQTAERKKELEKLYGNLKDLKTKSDKTSGLSEEERAEQIEKIISSFNTSNVSPEEAKKLEDLGEQLRNLGGEPNLADSGDELL